MCDLMQVEQLLQEKQQLLLTFEDTTERMISCPVTLLEDAVRERQKLIRQVEKLDEALDRACGEDPDGRMVRTVIRGGCNTVGLSEGMQAVYRAATQVRAVLSRLQESELQAASRLQLEQERILERIRANNQGVSAKAARFYSHAGQGKGGQTRLGNA